MDDIYIILTGSLVAISTGLLGAFLILRKMAMIGDAISHAVLPGIVIAFLISGSRSSIPVMLGAAVVGVLAAFFIETLSRRGKVQNDASIGIVFTFLFAVGVILVSGIISNVDIDQDCVLYGELLFVGLDTRSLLGLEIPAATLVLGLNFLIVIAFIVFGYRGLFLTTFDPAYAAAIGISTTLWHYLLMGAVSFTTVVSFESVGAILVVAFLVVPPATAYLLTHDLKKMLVLTIVIGVGDTILGYYVNYLFDASLAGTMAAVMGVVFLIALIFYLITKRKTGIEQSERLDTFEKSLVSQ